jgi:hypothetical protein
MNSNNVFKAVVGLNLVQAVLRLAFMTLSLNGGMSQFLNDPITQVQADILFACFSALGAAGLVSVILALRRHPAGVISLAAVSVATIAFDIYGMSIQPTAAIGFVVPAITLVAIFAARDAFVSRARTWTMRA